MELDERITNLERCVVVHNSNARELPKYLKRERRVDWIVWLTVLALICCNSWLFSSRVNALALESAETDLKIAKALEFIASRGSVER